MIHLCLLARFIARIRVYTDILPRSSIATGAIMRGPTLLAAKQRRDADLKQQDNLYTVAERCRRKPDGACGGRRQKRRCMSKAGWSGTCVGGDVRTANSDCVSDHYRERVLSFASHGPTSFLLNIP